jgi:membrane-associated phospholipid phosphatase
MNSKPYTSWNSYFLVPFIIWVAAGGLGLLIFDRQFLFSAVNTRHTPFLDVLMLYTTRMGEGVFIPVVLMVLFGFSSLRNWWFFIAAIFSNIVPNLITQAIKSSVNAPRPLKYFDEAEWIHTVPEWPRFMDRSFPSGHTTGAFCLFCFLALLLPPKYKQFGLLFFILALAVAYSRMYLAAHFFLDVYVGSIIATIFTISVVALMNRYHGRFFKGSPGI